MTRKLTYISIWNLLFILFAGGTLQADNAREQCLNSQLTPSRVISQTHFSDVPLLRISGNEFHKELSGLVQHAEDIVGRADMTSTHTYIGSFERTDDRRDPKCSVEIMEDVFASPGQNIKHLSTPNDAASQIHHGSTLTSNKRITKESPTSNPLSFAWEYLETKK